MAGNLIVINKSEGLTWYVGDSKMDELMEFLHKIGRQEQPTTPPQTDTDIRMACAFLDETCVDCDEDCPAAGS